MCLQAPSLSALPYCYLAIVLFPYHSLVSQDSIYSLDQERTQDSPPPLLLSRAPPGHLICFRGFLCCCWFPFLACSPTAVQKCPFDAIEIISLPGFRKGYYPSLWTKYLQIAQLSTTSSLAGLFMRRSIRQCSLM